MLTQWMKREHSQFVNYQKEIENANIRSLYIISIVGVIVTAFLILLSLPMIGVLHLFLSYLTLFLIFLTTMILTKTILPKHGTCTLLLYYILMLLIYSVAIYMGTVEGITTNATTFILFMLLLPLFIIDHSYRLILFNVCMTTIFVYVDCHVKSPGPILSLDISNAIVICLVSIAFIIATLKRNFRVFATNRREEEEIEKKNQLINLLPVGVAAFEVIGQDVKQIYTNDEFYRLFRDTKEERASRTKGNFLNGIHPDDRRKLGAAMQSVIDGKDYVTQACRSITGDGSYIWVRFSSAVAQRSEDHLVVYSTYSSMEDEMKSRQATQAKTDFLSRVSHDMRTPLNGILGLTSLIQEETQNKAVLDDLQQLQMSSRYLLNLINDTLDVSKIESGKLTLSPVVCDGQLLFNNVLTLVKPNIQEKNITLNVKAGELPFTMLYIDVARVEQIVMNILGNAVKFTPEGGSIDVFIDNLSVEKGIITDRIIIKDTGIGMKPEFIPHLFEPFSQEDNGRTSTSQGTGLGMTITKQILEIMGGTIQVDSEPMNGTTFTLEIPMTIATEEQVKDWKNHHEIVTDDSILVGKRVLLCEDHPLNTTIATRLLEKKQMLVEHASNGQEGVALYEHSAKNYYDVILMDIRMPEMDGLEATRTIRALPREDAKEIPIIAMTANAFEEDVKATQDAGMNAHLGKPIDNDKLYLTLSKFL